MLMHFIDRYSTKSETERYPPIVAGLNSIICSFENVKIGQLEASDDSVFMVNDPIPIKSADVSASGDDGHSLAISDGMPRTTKRKPDVTKSRLRWLRGLIPQNKDFGLKDWVKALRSEHEQFLEARKKAAKEGSRLSWNDITECWEVKAGKVLDGEHLAYLDRTFDASNIVVASGELRAFLSVWRSHLTIQQTNRLCARPEKRATSGPVKARSISEPPHSNLRVVQTPEVRSVPTKTTLR